jgi:high-affinity Fe2+/Pb2+ permease
MGTASWYLYQSKKAGWYLTLALVLGWFLALPIMKIVWSAYTIILTAGMLAVLVWLLQSSVKENYGVKF